MSEENTSSSNAMAESSITDSGVNDGSDISSQLSEMKENYERKIGELQSEFSKLKDLTMVIINKSNNDIPSTSSQGLSKRPQVRQDTDTRLEVTKNQDSYFWKQLSQR